MEAGESGSVGDFSGASLLKKLRRAFTEPIPMTPPSPKVIDKLEKIGWANFSVLILVMFWLFPAAPLYLEAGYVWYALALVLGMGVAGVSAVAGLHEGMRRLLTCIRAKDELERWDPAELLEEGATELGQLGAAESAGQ